MRFTTPLLMVGLLIFMIGAVTSKKYLIETDDDQPHPESAKYDTGNKKRYPIETGNMDVTEDEGADYFLSLIHI